MPGIQYVLTGVALCILGVAIIIVVRGRLAELSAEREAARSMQRMAHTLTEAQRGSDE